MTKKKIDELIAKYGHEIDIVPSGEPVLDSQVAVRDREILYALLREYKPRSVIEYGTRYGGCTVTILSALFRNKKPFRFYPFEKDKDSRKRTMKNLRRVFRKKIEVYGAIEDDFHKLPEFLDFGFIDHNHQADTTLFFLGGVLPKFESNGLIGIHDWENGPFDESKIIDAIYSYLPLRKFYWTNTETPPLSTGWFKKK